MKEKVKILIVEDEALIAENLKISINFFGYNTIGIVDSAIDALDFLLKNEVDFVIIDVNIKGEKTGIWLAKYISTSFDIPFIFLTAYSDSETVAKALETKPSGYLVKPFTKENIGTTIKVALNNFTKRKELNTSEEKQVTSEENIVRHNKTYFFIKDKNSFVKINFSDVLFLEADNNYVHIVTNPKKIILRNSLSKISKELPSNFVQVHRSFYVNKNNIDRIDAMVIHIKNFQIPLSNSYKQELLDSLNKLM